MLKILLLWQKENIKSKLTKLPIIIVLQATLFAFRKTMILIIILLLLLSLMFTVTSASNLHPLQENIDLWFFWGDGCRICSTASIWLDELSVIYPDLLVHKGEVWYDMSEQHRYVKMMLERGEKPSGVPVFIINDIVFLGFNNIIASEIEREVLVCLGGDIIDNVDKPVSIISLGPLKDIGVPIKSVLGATILIAFIDGFNPCSLWVLTILLAMILNTKSRAKIIAVGVTFLIVTAFIYGLFITGLFGAQFVTKHLSWVRLIIILIAIVFALVNIKDYFFHKDGYSLAIPNWVKPKIFNGSREIRKDRPLYVVLILTVVFATVVAIVELPCTAGFPMVWTSFVTDAGTTTWGFVSLLMVYLAVYLFAEIAILVMAIVAKRIPRLQKDHGRILKLINGIAMTVIAIFLLIH